jgi:hypothetical protein
MYVLILPYILNHSIYHRQIGEGPSNAMTTPRKSPRNHSQTGEVSSNPMATPRKRLGLKKKLTPRKGEEHGTFE